MTNKDTKTLALSTPHRESPAEKGVDVRPKAFEKWINALPRANIGECSRLYFKQLRQLNRLEISDADRFKILEMFREPGGYISNALKKHYMGLAFPLSSKKIQIAMLNRELDREMALGYKIIVENRASGQSHSVDNKSFNLSLHRCFEYLGRVLVRSYQVYEHEPASIWSELHALYQYAEQYKLHLGLIPATGTSIDQLYKRSVLLSLACPHRLRQTDIEKVYKHLLRWSNGATLIPVSDEESQAGMYCVNLAGNEGPGFFVANSEQDASTMRLLDTSALVQTIQDKAMVFDGTITNSKDTRLENLPRHTLEQLMIIWSGLMKRHSTRTKKNANVQIVMGLRATHHFLMEKEHADHPDENPSASSPDPEFDVRSRFSTGVAGPSNIDLWNPVYTIAAHSESYDVDFDSDSVFKKKSANDESYESHICASVNESAGGFRLVWIPWEGKRPSLNALVGELIGLREVDEETDSQWNIAVIRWLKINRDNKLELGVEKLAPFGMAVGVQAIVKARTAGDYQRALVLPELKGINQPETLITPSYFEAGKELKLHTHGKTTNVKLVKLQESTGAFSQYQFKEIYSAWKAEHSDDTDKDQADSEFDGIWNSL